MRSFIAFTLVVTALSVILSHGAKPPLGAGLTQTKSQSLRADPASPTYNLHHAGKDTIQQLHVDKEVEKAAEEESEEDPFPHVSVSALLDKVIPNNFNYVAVNASYSNLWEEMATFPERNPRLFNLLLATTKTWGADLLVQLGTFEADSPKLIDWRRSAAFAVFGLLYIGAVQWALYVTFFSEIFPNAMTFANEPFWLKEYDRDGQVDLAKQVMMDNFLVQPFIYFPVFYAIKGLVRRLTQDPAEHQAQDEPHLLLKPYEMNFWKDNLYSMAIWIPGDMIVYSAPMYLRMPLDHAVSFLWTMVLSYMRGPTPGKKT